MTDRKLTAAGWLSVAADEVRIEPASVMDYLRKHPVQSMMLPLGVVGFVVMSFAEPRTALYMVSGVATVIGFFFMFAFVVLVVQTRLAAHDAWTFRRDDITRKERRGTTRHPRERVNAVRATTTISWSRASRGNSRNRTTDYAFEVELDDGNVFSLPQVPYGDQTLIAQALTGLGYRVERVQRDLTR